MGEAEFSRKGKDLQSSCKICVKLYHQKYYEKIKINILQKIAVIKIANESDYELLS
jgi:hypothetical protein